LPTGAIEDECFKSMIR